MRGCYLLRHIRQPLRIEYVFTVVAGVFVHIRKAHCNNLHVSSAVSISFCSACISVFTGSVIISLFFCLCFFTDFFFAFVVSVSMCNSGAFFQRDLASIIAAALSTGVGFCTPNTPLVVSRKNGLLISLLGIGGSRSFCFWTNTLRNSEKVFILLTKQLFNRCGLRKSFKPI